MAISGSPTPDARATRNAAKRARLESIAAGKHIPRVRVTPASDEIRRVLRHPHGGAFRSKGSAEWPLDRFTQRRLAEGAVTIEDEKHADEKHAAKA